MEKDPIRHRLAEAYLGLRLLLRRRLKNDAIADDILNDASAVAIDHYRAGRVSDPRRIGGYVYRVAMNLYRNHARDFDNRGDVRAGEDALAQLPSDEHAPEDSLGARFAAMIPAIIAALPTQRDREIIVRLYLEEESKESICRSLGISPLHFDKVAFRTRQRLRVLLENQGITREVLDDA